MRKLYLILIALILFALVGGDNDYRSLNELTIISGFAIDYSEEEEDSYTLTFEVLDISSGNSGSNEDSGSGSSVKLIESTGDTIYDAINRLNNKFQANYYFANAEIIIISHQIAEKEGISDIIDTLMRSINIRDTIPIAISKEESAKTLFYTYLEDSETSFSLSLVENSTFQNSINKSKENSAIYYVLNRLSQDYSPLVLAAFDFWESTEKNDLAYRSLAVFDGDKLAGYLTGEQASCYVFMTNKLANLDFSFYDNDGDGLPDASLRILENEPTLDYRYENGKLTVISEVSLMASAIELPEKFRENNNENIHELENLAAESLEKKIKNTIEYAKEEFGLDPFGFSYKIYTSDPKLWEEIKDNWTELFINSDIEVNCKFTIKDLGLTNILE